MASKGAKKAFKPGDRERSYWGQRRWVTVGSQHMLTAVGAAVPPAGKSGHKGSKGSPPYSDDEGTNETSDVEDAEDYKKGKTAGCYQSWPFCMHWTWAASM